MTLYTQKPMTELTSVAKAIVDAFDVEYYQKATNRYDALAAALRAVVQNCSGVDYDGGKRIATVSCVDILTIADELESKIRQLKGE